MNNRYCELCDPYDMYLPPLQRHLSVIYRSNLKVCAEFLSGMAEI